MARGDPRLEIDWEYLFGRAASPDSEDVCSPSPSPAPRATSRAWAPAAKGVPSGDERRRGTTRPLRMSGGGFRSEIHWRVGERRPREHEDDPYSAGGRSSPAPAPCSAPRRDAAAQGADDCRRDAHSAANKMYKFDIKDDAVLQALGKSNKSVHASLKSTEHLQAPGAAPPEEICVALQAIPRLACSDLLRAYSRLIRDDRGFRSLMALPNNMRKEWLLMEIGS